MSSFRRSLLLLSLLGVSFISLATFAQTNFGSVAVGGSATATVTVTIPTAESFNAISVLTMGASGQDYTPSGTGTCKVDVAYAANQTCTVGVTFKPLYAGQRKGAVSLFNSDGEYATTFIQGFGTAPQLAFVAGVATALAPTLDGFPLTPVDLKDPPRGSLAVDGGGTVYIASSVLNQNNVDIARYVLLKIAADGAQSPLLLSPDSDRPSTVRVNGAGDRIITSSHNYITVLVPPSDETSALEINHLDGHLLAPAVDGASDLFLYNGISTGEVVNNNIVEFPKSNFRDEVTLNSVYADTADPAPPVTPVPAQAVDAAGDIYIAWLNHIVIVPANQLSGNAPANGYNTITPVVDGVSVGSIPDLAFDGADDLLIADPQNNRIVEVPVGGGPAFAINPVVDGKGLNYPDAVAFDLAGNLYILDAGNQRVVEVHTAQAPALTFARTSVNTTSSDSPQTVPVQNVGNTPLTFSSLSYPADFPEQSGGTSACTASTPLQPGQICNLNIDFAPVNGGILKEAVNLADNSLNQAEAAQAIDVSGLSTGTGILLSANSIAFPSQQVNTPGASQQLTLTNYFSTPLEIVGIQVVGADASSFDFGSNCPMILPVNATCIIHGHFIPATVGPLSAAVLIQHHDAGSPQMLPLSGIGLTPGSPSVSTTSLSYGTQPLFTSSASQQVILSNVGGAPLHITGVTLTGDAGDFNFSGNCSTYLPGGSSCIIHGHFDPYTVGPHTATITITEDATGSPQIITLTGTGQ